MIFFRRLANTNRAPERGLGEGNQEAPNRVGLPLFFIVIGLEIAKFVAEKRDIRKGQILYNLLHELRPDLAHRMVGQTFDPFYTDDYKDPVFQEALDFIEKNW